MKMKFIMVLASVLLSAIPAYAVNWELVSGTDNSEVYIDTESVIRKGYVIEVWVMYDFANTKQLAYSLKDYKSEIDLDSYDSINRTVTNLSSTLYAENRGHGDVVSSHETGKYASPSRLIPGSIGESIMKYLFKNIPDKRKN